MALTLLGEGEFDARGGFRPAGAVRAVAGWESVELEAWEGVRVQPGRFASAARLLALLGDSQIRESHPDDDPRIQDAYSLRCRPQLHGAAQEALDCAASVLETVEIKSGCGLTLHDELRILEAGGQAGAIARVRVVDAFRKAMARAGIVAGVTRNAARALGLDDRGLLREGL